MNAKIKLVLGITGAIALMGGAYISYQALTQDSNPGIAQTTSESSVSQNGDSQTTNSSNQDTDTQPQKLSAPDFTMLDADGNEVRFSDFEGKPVVINFWATWCGYCTEEMPLFDTVYKEMGDEVQFIMLDLTDNQGETVELAKNYVTQAGYSFPVYFDANREAAMTYGISSVPFTLFVDKDGYIVAPHLGLIDEQTLRQNIELIKDAQ